MVHKTQIPSNTFRPNRQRRFALSNLFRSILPSGSALQWLAIQAGAVTPDDGEPLTTLACPSCGATDCSFVGAGLATADREGDTTLNMVDSEGCGHCVGPFMLVLEQGGENLAYPQGQPAVFSVAECGHCRTSFGFQIAHEHGRLALRVSLLADLSVPDADDPIPAARREVTL
ncbi:hypothetical protein [Rhodopirellula sp. P2]|uniref:hypothetical protein n=1 Tax=Rhodopirellula sp. P2 TaxID=2127060 RepID=UPI002368A9EF|nr:hypothetical protein [Rhodopirellula sp. P2]WDQ16379.1 hypothetical protein PSR62_22550 [Rhodopirellula sp. P2]